ILSSVNGVGPAVSGGGGATPLQTDVANLMATNTNNGIEINNVGALTLTRFGNPPGTNSITNTNGGFAVIAGGTINVNDPVQVGRRFALTANTGTADINVNA